MARRSGRARDPRRRDRRGVCVVVLALGERVVGRELPARRADDLSVAFSGKRAVVALGASHAEAQSVPVTTSGGRIRFTLPARPALSFDGAIEKGRFAGSIRQGTLHGTFSTRAGGAPSLMARGMYAAGGGVQAVVDDPYGPPRIVDLDSGGSARSTRPGPFSDRHPASRRAAPTTGTASFNAAGARIEAPRRRACACASSRCASERRRHARRDAVAPTRRRRHAAVAFVHGSG